MGRSPCCEKADTNKGAWTKEEDQRLIDYIRLHGEGSWRSLPKSAGLRRCGKSCRLRWINYLRPDLKRGNFSKDEDDLIIKLHALLGNKWSLIAGRLPGRTDNEIKNYWNTHMKRKLIKRGIDPQTHRPLVTLTHTAQPNMKLEAVEDFTNTTHGGDDDADSAERQVPNLDLSIGLLPFRSDKPSFNSTRGPLRVCLCWQLGYQYHSHATQLCTNCHSSTSINSHFMSFQSSQ